MTSRSAKRRILRRDQEFARAMRKLLASDEIKSYSPERQDYVRYAADATEAWIKSGRSGGKYPGPATEEDRDQVILWWAEETGASLERVRAAILAQKEITQRRKAPWLFPVEGESEQDRAHRLVCLTKHWIKIGKHEHGEEDIALVHSICDGYPDLERSACEWEAVHRRKNQEDAQEPRCQ